MKNFIKMVFASAIGVCIASIVLSFISFFMFLAIFAGTSRSKAFTPEKNTVLKIELNGVLNDRVLDNPFAGMFGDEVQEQSLTDVLDAIKKAKENDNIKGIYIKSTMTFSAGVSSLETIREALKDFKESGKFIVTYGDNYSQGCYYVSALADKVLLNPLGMVDLHGMAATPMFYKGLLDKLGVKMEIFKVGTFKSAVEPFMLDKMSDANREQVTSYMGNIWENITKDIAADRQLDVNGLNALIDEGLLFSNPQKVQEVGMVDSLLYAPEVEEYLKNLLDLKDLKDVKIASVADLKSLPFKDKKEYSEKIAVLFAEGEITTASTGFFQANTIISDEEYVKELRKLKDNEDIKAVVFRVNSPGGSGYISEQIWREVVELKKVKPIVVSMGDVAASGGYYISCAADWIVAEPTTITGSIGVFGMFPNFEGLYGKVGLTSDVVKTNTFADLGDPSRQMRPDEKVLIQKYIEEFYDIFLNRCADGRKMTKAAIDSIGQGRVWSGEQALAIGLVDELGTLDRAIAVAADRAGLKNYTKVNYPEPKSFWEAFMEESMGSIKMRITKGLLDDVEFRHLMMVRNIKQQDKIQARLPFE